MAERVIPQRELRNNVGGILREVEAGTEFTITVRGRAIARLGPLDDARGRQIDVGREALLRALEATPVDRDYAGTLAGVRAAEAPVDDSWEQR